MSELLMEKTMTGTTAASDTQWYPLCRLDELETTWGEAALIAGRQVAVFKLSDAEVYAVQNRDPVSGSEVMARGIVGSRGLRPTIASPLHKEIYDLETGECLSNPALGLRTYPVQVVDGFISVGH